MFGDLIVHSLSVFALMFLLVPKPCYSGAASYDLLTNLNIWFSI